MAVSHDHPIYLQLRTPNTCPPFNAWLYRPCLIFLFFFFFFSVSVKKIVVYSCKMTYQVTYVLIYFNLNNFIFDVLHVILLFTYFYDTAAHKVISLFLTHCTDSVTSFSFPFMVQQQRLLILWSYTHTPLFRGICYLLLKTWARTRNFLRTAS
jgi:hypothetical protein